MISKKFYRVLFIVLLATGVFMNFWIFSRFTVDDAFITFRYGKNLVEHGNWNYNPSNYDMTQGYTSSVFAFLSIVPAYFKIDAVLFFKILAIVSLIIFGVWYSKKTVNGIYLVLLSYILPHIMIHSFSGLETFVFTALLAALLIAIYEDALHFIICFTICLLYTRPESLVLLFCVPFIFCNWQSYSYKDLRGLIEINNYKPKNICIFLKKFITKKAFLIFLILVVSSLPNFLISYINFGSIIPNTFYVKNSSFNLSSIKKLTVYGITLLPLLSIFRYLPLKKSVSIFLFFVLVALQYSKSNLAMDYINRFAFHILFPIVFFVYYIINKKYINVYSCHIYFDNDNKQIISFYYNKFCAAITIFVILFFVIRIHISELADIANYYHRCLNAHAVAGKTINKIKDKYEIKSIACGDAGMLAFNADVDSLDLVGLGSSTLTHKGLETAYQLYKPDVIFLYADLIDVRPGYMEEIKELSGLNYIGSVCWLKGYFLQVFAKNPIPELEETFAQSYALNYKTTREVLKEHIFKAPWTQWHE